MTLHGVGVQPASPSVVTWSTYRRILLYQLINHNNIYSNLSRSFNLTHERITSYQARLLSFHQSPTFLSSMYIL